MGRKNFGKEHGNAVLAVMLAMVLFIAMSWALLRSDRSGESAEMESMRAAVSQITQYPATLRTTVMRMNANGVPLTEIDFTNKTGQENELFDPAGGGAVPQKPPINIGAAKSWKFKGLRDPENGYYIDNVGMDVAVDGREAIVYLDGLSLMMCEAINRSIGLARKPTTEATAVDFDLNGGAGGPGPAADNDHTFASSPGRSAACVENGHGGNYVFYYALIEQ